MPSKEGKFATFGGVFTPSLLTILGVIMYLRLPWVVGNAGIKQAVLIILVAHVISVSTGLSISSIATDKNVGAGGPYYIVSRSLGLPIGGTIGLTLFVGLAFSISLYIIGFVESFLGFWHWDTSITSVRIAGTLTIVALTAVTFISTALAIKTQYLILTLIALSLVSIFAGTPEPAAVVPHFSAHENSQGLSSLFGIFFPAVTGFTAGVNMSGDLQNPKRSIPRGTMAAILAGMAVYLGLAIYLGYRVPAKQLIGDQDVLLHVSLVPALVIAGIWGATISSGLGSILGAPRILQAISADGITPRILAKGYGKGNEPRNALIVAFAIGEAGILIGELDAIAEIVSMVFLALYCVLNLSCAVESWASPDFRPAFRIPKLVSLTGAVTAFVVMISLNLPAMIGATLIMTALFAYLTRRQLKLQTGDAWEGIWTSLVRSGLFRLSRTTRQQRNWRPNIVAFSGAGEGHDAALGAIGESLLGGTGMLTKLSFVPTPEHQHQEPPAKRAVVEGEPPPLGVFQRNVVADDPFVGIPAVCRYHGLAGCEPNTVLLDWDGYGKDPQRLAALLAELAELDINQLIFVPDRAMDAKRESRIDVWWREGAGNLQLSLSLVRFLTASQRFEDARVRFLVISDDVANNDILRTTARRYLVENRIDAAIKVLSNTFEVKPIEEWVRAESTDSLLCIVPLPNEASAADHDFLTRIDRALDSLHETLLFRASSAFEEVLSAGRTAAVSLAPGPPGEESATLAPVELPRTPDLAILVQGLADAYKHVVHGLDEHCALRVYGANIELVRRIRQSLEKQLDQLDKGLAKGNVRRQQHAVNRASSSFLIDAQRVLERFEQSDLEKQRAILEGGIEAFLHNDGIAAVDPKRRLRVHRHREDFRPGKDDSAYVRRFKRRRRWLSPFGSGPLRYAIPDGRLRAYYRQKAIDTLLRQTLVQLAADTHQLTVQLGKVLSSSRAYLEVPEEISDEAVFRRRFAEQQARALKAFDDLVAKLKRRSERQRQRLLAEGQELIRFYADDVDRFDLPVLVKKQRRLQRASPQDALLEIPTAFYDHQVRLFERAGLAVRVSSFQHRLAAVVERQGDAIALEIKNGVKSDCLEVRDALHGFLQRLQGSDQNDVERPALSLELASRFDARHYMEALVLDVNESVSELPETLQTLSDESIEKLEEGKLDAAEVVDLELLRLARFLVETELLGGIQDEIEAVPEIERRAAAITQDVVRLVGFQLSEFDSLGFTEPGDFAAHMMPVVENGLERVDAQLEALNAIAPRLEATIDRRLQVVVERTNPYELTRSSASLEQYIRLRKGKKAVSEAHGVLRRAAAAVKRGMVSVLYRASAGVVLARTLKARAETSGNVVDSVLTLVTAASPRPEVLRSLPFYYRQLFLGQSLNDTFWVGRRSQLEKARSAVMSYRHGAHGAIVVTGDRGSGKTALCQRVTARLLERAPVYWVRASRGGSIDPQEFKRALEKAVEVSASYKSIFSRLPEHSTLVIDDLELWWQRSERGIAVIDVVLDLIAHYGHRCLFLLSVGGHALSLLNRLRPLADSALTVLECTPMDAEALGAIITLRHGSTGVKFSLGGKDESELSQWQLARLFSHHFNYSRGSVGVALTSWLAHVDEASKNTLSIRLPQGRASDVLDGLRIDWTALLMQFVLHKQLTRPRLAEITGLGAAELDQQVAALLRMGLVVEDRRAIELNRFAHHIVTERFTRRGLLS